MRRNAILSTLCGGLIIGLMLASGVARGQSDPCNFNDGSAAFTYERVMECYERVPFNPADLSNAVAFLRAARDRSDLREVFQARYNWRGELDSLATRSFDNDHDLQLALVDNHKKFYNPHWRYQRPTCYTTLLASYIPFDFGSAVLNPRGGQGPEQIIFVEAAPYLADRYRSFTGIDANAYVGLRVVSVNGVPALEYFRRFGTEVYRYDENPGSGLNEVLQNGAYSIRSSQSHDVPHDRAVDVFVFESRTGQRFTVNIPWVFVPRGAFGLGPWPLTFFTNTARFTSFCLQPSSVSTIAGNVITGAGAEIPAADAGNEFRKEIAEKREMVQRLDNANAGRRAEYFEAPPGQNGQQLSVIVPKRDGAVAYQLSDRATIIRLDDFSQNWKDEVIAATNYACTNSQRLIFDMRNNNGGALSKISWLTRHLLPERSAVKRDHLLGGQFLQSDAGRNELVARMTLWRQTNEPERSCWFGYEAGCFIDAVTEQPLGDDGWSQGSMTVQRGGTDELLSRQVLFPNTDPVYSQLEPIACPGKFRGSSLIIYTNGTGVSAGYFWPAIMRPDVTMTSGGILNEPIVYGVARGGAVWSMNGREAYWEQWLETDYGPASQPLPFMVRAVDSFIEQPGSYQRGSTNLYIDDPAFGDAHVDVWNDSPTTDRFVYGRVLNAVQRMR